MRPSISMPYKLGQLAVATAALVCGVGLASPAPADAVPRMFTSTGDAVSYQDGKAMHVPNTLYYQNGKIRLEMAAPVSADGTSPFSIVLAQDGGKSITLLNAKDKQAMKLEASSLQEVTENKSLQKISTFKLSEFGKTFRAQGKALGKESVAGEACTILEHKGKDGHFKMWLSDHHDLPMKFTYFDKGKPAFSYEVSHLVLSANLPASAFQVPAGYEMTDLSELLKGMDNHH